MSMPVTRRHFLAASGAGLFLWNQSVSANAQDLVWYDVRDWGVEGKGWHETASYFDRLPARAEGKVPAGVWRQSRHSAGMLVRFRSDARVIWSDHTVTSERLGTPDLASIGASGLDLYATDAAGNWKWLSVTRPRQREMKGTLITGLAEGERDYQLYLPLYNQTESLRIGVPKGSFFKPIEPRQARPLLFYGTSITQGASASRAGMPHAAILGRRLNRPVINLGFGGAGRMEQEVGELLCELDPLVYVIDCLPNMTGVEVEQRAVPLVQQLRLARPATPIVLVEDRTYPNAPFLPGLQQRHLHSRTALQQAYRQLKEQGVKQLSYISGDELLGADREDTSDGSHPTDLGFWRQAEVFEKTLRAVLTQP